MKISGYMASHAINEAMAKWVDELVEYIEEKTGIDMYVSNRHGINRKGGEENSLSEESIFGSVMDKLEEADIMVANLDEIMLDCGVVAAEVVAFAQKQREMQIKCRVKRCEKQECKGVIIGIVTDKRVLGDKEPYLSKIVEGAIMSCGPILVGYDGTDEYKQQIVDIILDYRHSRVGF